MSVIKTQAMENNKLRGAVYTPPFIVDIILNMTGYDKSILEKHVIDNSCGDGAFLTAVVHRYCRAFLTHSKDKKILKNHLAAYIHGMDNDPLAVKSCLSNLDNEAASFGVDGITWDVTCANTLEVKKYNGKMDFVVGNPPYIRVHNLKGAYDSVKNFSFAANGMTDLFIVFFEIGFKMLNSNGKMGLITPSSFLRSKAGNKLRQDIQNKQTLSKVLDLGHFQPFKATTYTIVTVFDSQKRHDAVDYFTFDPKELSPNFVERLPYQDIFVNEKMFFSSSKNLKTLHKIESHFSRREKRSVIVKNGLATLADKVFIGAFDFSEGTINILKASTGKWHECIFPYRQDGTPMTWKEVSRYKRMAKYLESQKPVLLNRDIENDADWFLFGRTQAIKDVFVNKLSVNTMIKDIKSLKVFKVAKGQGVYSELYVLSPYSEDKIRAALLSEDFIEYLKLLKNYKSGGYYTFSSLELEKYLSYKLEETFYGQLGLFENTRSIISSRAKKCQFASSIFVKI